MTSFERAIAGAALLLFTGLAGWGGYSLDKRLARVEAALKRLEQQAAQTPPTTTPGPSPTRPALRRPATPPAPQLTQEEFSSVWRGEPRARAERECFAPVDARGETIESNPHFTVTVAADGSISTVVPDREGEFSALYKCVGDIVAGLKLEATGTTRSGMVQAERPPDPRNETPAKP